MRKLWILLPAFSWLAVGSLRGPNDPQEWVVVLTGDNRGYLAPCGCSSPMIGGVVRRATALKSLTAGKQALVLDNGGWVEGTGRQDVLKAEALAQLASLSKVSAVNLAPSEAKLGRGQVLALQNLSGGRFVSSCVASGDELDMARFASVGPFLVGGVSGDPGAVASPLGLRPLALDRAVETLIEEASHGRLVPVLMLQGTLEQAREVAKQHPKLRLIAYRSGGTPPEPEQVGETLLASCGDKGKYLASLRWDGKKFSSFRVTALDLTHADDPNAQRLYRSYLDRVGEEDLLAKLPRTPSEVGFVGSERCGTCHKLAHGVWSESAHAKALATLEKVGHDRDPDCVGCHVVGLESKGGFASREVTPSLAGVGCENCHGPGARHVLDPFNHSLAAGGEKSCAKCHVPDHSPKFVYDAYWPKISH
ncbi:MAG: hypothetical protein L6Q31_02825 [Fimbriimonadaceae bacterium]|nr:hypothetical protein [Fimbriimonadaceae bacterium]NUM39076.1 hypothetical protein [Armatimonadota bacterium]